MNSTALKLHVHNLGWTMRSPGLIALGPQIIGDQWCQDTFRGHRAAIDALLSDPQPLANAVHDRCHNHRLGEYFEVLVDFWLRDILKFNNVQRNVQVRGPDRTLGEFDFLFEEPTSDHTTHWEVAIKFYLYHPESNLFWGPTAKDRFDRKLDLVFNHQLKLPAIAGWKGSKNIRSMAFIKGRLFYPLESDWQTTFIEPVISSSHARGWWTSSTAAALNHFGRNSRWHIHRTKRTWLAGVIDGDGDGNCDGEWLSALEFEAHCQKHFQNSTQSFMVSTEHTRGFMVHPSWPSGI